MPCQSTKEEQILRAAYPSTWGPKRAVLRMTRVGRVWPAPTSEACDAMDDRGWVKFVVTLAILKRPRMRETTISFALRRQSLSEWSAQRMLEPDAPHVHDFSNDRDRDLLRQDCADIQADRHVHALEAFARNAFAFELLGNRADLALASDHADVAGLGLNGPSQDVLILLVAARDDDDVRVVGRHDLLERFLEALRIDRLPLPENVRRWRKPADCRRSLS